MTTFQKWLLGLLAAFGIGTVAVVTKPTTPSTPTPPPVVVDTTHHDTTVTPPPVTPAGSYTPLASDSFAEYATTSALQAKITKNIGGTCTSSCTYNDGGNATLASIDPSVLYHGHATMKYTQPGGVATTPELWPNLPTSLTVMWFKGVLRWSPGFTTTGTLSNSANAYKIFGWGWDATDGRGSLEFTNTNQYSFVWSIIAKSGSPSASTIQNGPTTVTEWTDGQWYDYIVLYKQTSATQITESWWLAKDGETTVLSKTITGTAPSGVALPKINRVMIGINFNQTRAANQSQAVWWGSWEVVDGSRYPDPYNVLGSVK